MRVQASGVASNQTAIFSILDWSRPLITGAHPESGALKAARFYHEYKPRQLGKGGNKSAPPVVHFVDIAFRHAEEDSRAFKPRRRCGGVGRPRDSETH